MEEIGSDGRGGGAKQRRRTDGFGLVATREGKDKVRALVGNGVARNEVVQESLVQLRGSARCVRVSDRDRTYAEEKSDERLTDPLQVLLNLGLLVER